jgi:predicted negative regulator of RcsB-dependent stress response
VDRLTRKELKTDRFALEVGQIFEYLSEHQRESTRYGVAAAIVLLLVIGFFYYRRYQHNVREQALNAALRIQDAQVGQPGNEFIPGFPTQAAKDQAVLKAFTDLASKYPGSDEGIIARYSLGTLAADQGKNAEAEKDFQAVIDSRNATYGSLAKLSLAELYAAQGKLPEAEKLVSSVMDKPSVLVSKEQATIVLARLLAPSRPAEARKLLEPLRTARSVISRAALTALSELPSK